MNLISQNTKYLHDSIGEFSKQILFSQSLDDKFIGFDFDLYQKKSLDIKEKPLELLPKFPGRPEFLLKKGAAKFPNVNEFSSDYVRGQVLHFFANHELLAMELMALVLLKFPDAPEKFRLGVVQTILEEQNHMRLYLARMNQLGVDFGDLPLSDYFWSCMKEMKSPMDFVVQMSLTFEQANLDYSYYYKNEVLKFGDLKTAEILERVYQEEIGHVKHGYKWFNHWRSKDESDWQAYRKLLPPPLTPRRAKGNIFDVRVRREIGFSEEFIRELSINESSKGRLPRLWFFNPSCESEVARNRPGHTSSKMVEDRTVDLESQLIFLAQSSDIIMARRRPSVDHLEKMTSLGLKIPEFITDQKIPRIKISAFEPWGWSPEVFQKFKPYQARLVEGSSEKSNWNKKILNQSSFQQTGLGVFFSKAWGVSFLKNWMLENPTAQEFFGDISNVGEIYTTYEAAISNYPDYNFLFKAPYGTSGNQIKIITEKTPDHFDDKTKGWIHNVLRNQGSIVREKFLNKTHDISIQFEIRESAIGEPIIKLYEAREFITDEKNQYIGTVLGKNFWTFSKDEKRFFNNVFRLWKKFINDLGMNLYHQGYRGPVGVDALIWRDTNCQLFLKPLVEVNPRWTMGRVALEFEKFVSVGDKSLWVFRKNDYSIGSEFCDELAYPAEFSCSENGKRLISGAFQTNETIRSDSLRTFLLVGEPASRFISQLYQVRCAKV